VRILTQVIEIMASLNEVPRFVNQYLLFFARM